MLKLSIQDSEGRSTIVPLSDGELSIGRDEANSICLTDRNVSRQHARLTTKAGHVWVENVSATYGTRFNSLLLKERSEIKKGDLVQVGDYTLELVGEDGAPAKRDTALVDASSKAAAAPAASVTASKPKAPDGATAIVNLADIAALLKEQPAGESKNIPEGQQPRLVVESENMRGMELRITKTPIVVGRVRENADLVIDHRSISKEHARLTRMPDGNWQVLDLGSANGMKVNGEPYSKCDIRSGDRVELGHVTLRFLAAGAKAPAVSDEGGGAKASGKSNLPLLIAAGLGVVVVGAAVTFFVMRGGEKEQPVEPAVKQAGTSAGEAAKKDDEDKGKEKPAADDKPDQKIDAAEAIKQADKLYKAGMLPEALTLLKNAQKDNAGNPQLELKTKQIEREVDAKALLDDAQGMLSSNPKEALETAQSAKAKLRDDSPLNEPADKLISAAKAALADSSKPKPVVAQPVQKVATPHEKAAPPEKKEPVKVEKVEAPVEAKKTPKDLYDEGRTKMLQGDTDGAVSSFKQAAKSGYGKAYGQLARIYMQKGDKSGCASAAKAYLDKYPDAGDAPQIQNMLEKCSN